MDPDELPYWIAFSVFPGIGPVRFRLLLQWFGTAQIAWNASANKFREIGIPQTLCEKFVAFRQTFKLDLYITELKKRKIRVVANIDPKFPELLAKISDPPIVLYICGNEEIALLSKLKLLAIVGTRRASSYGKIVTSQFSRELVSQGFSIVSGLALGIDGCAHQATLDAGGKTIAVLGCGVDIIAPSSHRNLYEQIKSSGGLIVSEMPLGHRPTKGVFPARNRIISGLSRAILITEGAKDSGSLITARYAAEQGRDVFAVPGMITNPMSEGPHKLIREGATLVYSSDQIMESLGFGQKVVLNKSIDFSHYEKDERQILQYIVRQPVTLDVLVRDLQIPTNLLSPKIISLELAGVITQDSDGLFHVTPAA